MSAAIRIVGAGPGAPECFTPAGQLAARQSDVVIGSERLLALVPDHPRRVLAGPAVEPTLEAIARWEGRKVAVLVSGDPGLCSLARHVVARFGRGACEVIPGISAVQVAFARVALEWSDARIVSAHGSIPDERPDALATRGKLAILLGCPAADTWLANLARALASSHTFVACSNLTMTDEQVWQVQPDDARTLATRGRTILLALRKDLWP